LQSIVLISAAEATDLTLGPPPTFNFNLGDADVYVTNVSPYDGGVEFILHVNWSAPLNVVVDICVFDPAEQFFVA
jgi:hypothetical protein